MAAAGRHGCAAYAWLRGDTGCGSIRARATNANYTTRAQELTHNEGRSARVIRRRRPHTAISIKSRLLSFPCIKIRCAERSEQSKDCCCLGCRQESSLQRSPTKARPPARPSESSIAHRDGVYADATSEVHAGVPRDDTDTQPQRNWHSWRNARPACWPPVFVTPDKSDR